MFKNCLKPWKLLNPLYSHSIRQNMEILRSFEGVMVGTGFFPHGRWKSWKLPRPGTFRWLNSSPPFPLHVKGQHDVFLTPLFRPLARHTPEKPTSLAGNHAVGTKCKKYKYIYNYGTSWLITKAGIFQLEFPLL